MKKKSFSTSKDKKDWLEFTKQPTGIIDKDISDKKGTNQRYKIKKLDLHGYSLLEANKKIESFIKTSHEEGCQKILVVTGKGLRSQVHNDPYKSSKMNILKDSVPDFIKNNQELMEKINKIESASLRDGGDGAFYIFLKK